MRLTHRDGNTMVCNLSVVSRREVEVGDQSTVSCMLIVAVGYEGKTNAKTAFISMIAIVLPIHPWGPAMNDMKENVGLYALGRSNQRSGRNLVNYKILA